jgi:post-segregation antitoxin (ccd killing protein)
LPRLQKLIDEYKDRADVLFLAFDVDANPGLVQPFMKEHAFSFIAIPAYTYVTQTLDVNGFPANWIVDANGIVRMKSGGFDISGKWETGIKDAIEKVKRAAGATPANPASHGVR